MCFLLFSFVFFFCVFKKEAGLEGREGGREEGREHVGFGWGGMGGVAWLVQKGRRSEDGCGDVVMG